MVIYSSPVEGLNGQNKVATAMRKVIQYFLY